MCIILQSFIFNDSEEFFIILKCFLFFSVLSLHLPATIDKYVFHFKTMFSTGIPGRAGFWTLDTRRWTQDAGLWKLDSECWTLDAKPWTLDSGRWTLDAGFWTLDFGRWILNLGHWTLGSGCWTLDAER